MERCKHQIWKPKYAHAIEISYNLRDVKWLYFPNPHQYSTRPVHTKLQIYIQLTTKYIFFLIYCLISCYEFVAWFRAMNS